MQVNVPTAQMEEILPAARLLSRATSPTPSDYERAKAAFLRGVRAATIQAQVQASALSPLPTCAAPQDTFVLESSESSGNVAEEAFCPCHGP